MKSESDRFSRLKGILEGRQKELSEELRKNLRETCQGTNGSHSFDEKAGATVDEIVHYNHINSKTAILRKINEALSRLERGIYGDCIQCGGEISEKRLEVIPFACRCTGCEELHEKREAPLPRFISGCIHV